MKTTKFAELKKSLGILTNELPENINPGVAELVAKAKKSGYEFEYHKATEGSGIMDQIGFTLDGKKNVYHWFKVCETYLSYDHTYSRNTGSTKKGVRKSIYVQTSLGFYK